MIWTKFLLVAALMASPLESPNETPVTVSTATQESFALRGRYNVKIPESSDIVYIRSVGVHHMRTEFSTIAWRSNSGGWIVSQVGEDGPGGLVKIKPRLIPETVLKLSDRDSRKLDKILSSTAVYHEQLKRSGTLGIGAPTHEMEIASSRGRKLVKWDGRLKGKAGRVADIILNR